MSEIPDDAEHAVLAKLGEIRLRLKLARERVDRTSKALKEAKARANELAQRAEQLEAWARAAGFDTSNPEYMP